MTVIGRAALRTADLGHTRKSLVLGGDGPLTQKPKGCWINSRVASEVGPAYANRGFTKASATCRLWLCRWLKKHTVAQGDDGETAPECDGGETAPGCPARTWIGASTWAQPTAQSRPEDWVHQRNEGIIRHSPRSWTPL